jgi:hypothetical protein
MDTLLALVAWRTSAAVMPRHCLDATRAPTRVAGGVRPMQEVSSRALMAPLVRFRVTGGVHPMQAVSSGAPMAPLVQGSGSYIPQRPYVRLH